MNLLTTNPADLAPGDARAAEFDFSPFQIHLIAATAHPLFDVAYRRLWDEFGSHGAMETRDVIADRLRWNPDRDPGPWRMRYRIILVTRDDRVAAVRDCTAIAARESPGGEVVVHLSHLLVEPDFRRSGLAAWLRALPIEVARLLDSAAPVTLVAEMEYPSANDPMSHRRLLSYEKAGFLKFDPSMVRYFQPDFRDFGEIDSSGGARPLPFQLVVRRVGREGDTQVSGGEVRRIVEALYAMYGRSFRPGDMEIARRTLQRYPPAEAVVRLLPPTM